MRRQAGAHRLAQPNQEHVDEVRKRAADARDRQGAAGADTAQQHACTASGRAARMAHGSAKTHT